MSPTEKELRAFLHAGEGEVPDTVSVLSNAMRVREVRRKRITTALTSAAAAVVVIGGSVLLVNAGDSGGGNAANGDDAGGMAASANRPALHSSDTTAAGGTSGTLRGPALPGPRNGTFGPEALVGLPMCPSAPTHYALPGGGALNAYGADGKVWKQAPNAMRVCAYVGTAQPASRLAYGDEAAALARTIESAPVTAAPTSCAAPRRPGGTIEIYALDAKQHRLKPVVINIPACGAAHATNGTASRYLSTLPADFAKAFAAAEKRALPHR